MPAASLPTSEAERLRALHDYGVLDTPPEPAFDELVALAARICGTPISLVTLIDHDRQWFKANHGLTLTQTPRALSFCAHALSQPGMLLIVPDATRDPRFADNPFVTSEAGIRFYAGVPLCTPGGHAVGTLCVIDRQPRTLSPDQQEALRVLGRQVMAQLELRRSLDQALLNHARLENSQRIAALGDWEYDFADTNHRLIWSDEVYRILGISRQNFPPNSETFYRQVHPDDLAFVHREKKAAANDTRRVDFEHRIIRADGEVRYIHQIAETAHDDQGRPIRESGTIQDVTERRRIQKELKAAKIAAVLSEEAQRYSFLADTVPLIIWTARPDGGLDYYNKAWFDYTGLTLTQTEDWGWGAVVHPDDLQPCIDRWTRSFTTGEDYEIEYRFKRGADGNYRWFLGRASARRNAEGVIVQWVGTCTDIDDQKRAHSELERRVGERTTELAKTNQALLRQQTELRVLFDLMPAMIWFKDTENRILRVNRQAAESAGMSTEEIEGKSSLEIYPQEAAKFYADDQEVIRSGTAKLGMVEPIQDRQGNKLWVQTDKVPYRDKDGKIVGIVVVAQDITARRQADSRLQASEIRYRRLFEAAQDGVLILNAETGMIEDVNPFLANLLDFTKEQLLGKRVWELGCFQNLIANRDKFTELQQKEYVRYDNLPLETASGRRIEVEFVSNVYEERGTKVVQCNIRDITSRKTAERNLRDSEERFKLVARAVSDVIWDWNLVTGNLWWSEGFMTTFGYAAGEIEPGIESWTSRIHPDELQRVVDGIYQAIDHGAESWAAEYRFRIKDGSYAAVQDSGYILRDETGRGLRMVGGMRDLTEEKKMEAQVLRAQRMDSIGTLAGGIAHDLNNVLAPILMSIELLRIDAGNDPRHRKILDTIFVSSQRGAALVRQVLSFARGVEGQRIAIHLRHLIDDLEGIISGTFPRNIRITTEIPNELWPVTGDPSQLQQVLLNLAVNGRDAMPDGGNLTISASNVTVDAQFASTSRELKAGPYVLLRVTDTGSGIPPEVRERIFEPFFTTKELGKGTGIGLATVHNVVKSHGGSVSVESEVGRGSTFKIYLPADPTLPISATPPARLTEPPRGRDELVLVVDDEFSIRHITQKTLEAFGYRVVTAGDGAEAVALYAKHSQEIAVVLTDMMMPIMDGAAMIQVLQRINPAVKIIAASGLSIGVDVIRAGGGHVKNFLPKPYTAETLLLRVREVIDDTSG